MLKLIFLGCTEHMARVVKMNKCYRVLSTNEFADEILNLIHRLDLSHLSLGISGGSQLKILSQLNHLLSDFNLDVWCVDERIDPSFSNLEQAKRVQIGENITWHDLKQEIPTAPLDIVLLGCGPDGHTASIFPNTKSIANDKVVAIDDSPKEPKERISMTLSFLNQCKIKVFIVTGAEKAEIVHKILVEKDTSLPAAMITDALWLLDRDAASKIS